MKVFWQLACLLVSHVLPQKTWELIESFHSFPRNIIKLMLFILISAIAIAMIYFLVVLPLKELGIRVYVK